jgi:hypothetical protein
MKTLLTVLLAALTAFTLACGYSSNATMPAQPGSMPAISALAPNTMASRGPSFVLTVNGSNYNFRECEPTYRDDCGFRYHNSGNRGSYCNQPGHKWHGHGHVRQRRHNGGDFECYELFRQLG